MDARKMSQAKRLKFARRSKTLDFGDKNDLLKKIEKEVDKDRKKKKLNLFQSRSNKITVRIGK